MKGSYVLLMKLPRTQSIQFGKHHCNIFKHGWYAYIGSAMNGLPSRIDRHFSNIKTIYWHIDYFLQHAHITTAYYLESNSRAECDIASKFAKSSDMIMDFGCSDCHCQSHLFHGSKQHFEEIITSLKMKDFKKQTLKTISGL